MDNRTERVEAIIAEVTHDLNAQVVAMIHGREVTRGELHEAFKRVEPRGNWKNPISAEFSTATVEADSAYEVEVIREAIVFFTGSVPTIRHLGNFRFIAQAAGYYAAVGA